jgi:hypothetical protein
MVSMLCAERTWQSRLCDVCSRAAHSRAERPHRQPAMSRISGRPPRQALSLACAMHKGLHWARCACRLYVSPSHPWRGCTMGFTGRTALAACMRQSTPHFSLSPRAPCPSMGTVPWSALHRKLANIGTCGLGHSCESMCVKQVALHRGELPVKLAPGHKRDGGLAWTMLTPDGDALTPARMTAEQLAMWLPLLLDGAPSRRRHFV